MKRNSHPYAKSLVLSLNLLLCIAAFAADQDAQDSSIAEITVTGSYIVRSSSNATGLDLSPRETPQSFTVITRQQIDDRALTNVAQILEQTTGINIGQAETDRVFPTARGFQITNVQLDGALIGGAAASVESDFLGDTAIYERVEIIRGAAGMLVGAGNPSAAINLVRKRPTKDLEASLELKGGRWGLARTVADVSGSLTANGKVRSRFVGAYQENDSYIDFLKQEGTTLYGILEADITDNSLLTVGIDYQKNHTDGVSYGETVPMFYTDGERTELPRSTTTGTDWTYRNRDRNIFFAELKHSFSNGWSASVSGSYLDGSYDDERVYVTGFLDRNTGEGLSNSPGKSAGDRKQASVDLRLRGPFSLFGREHDLVLGWNNSDEENDRRNWNALSTSESGNFFEWDLPYPGFSTDINNRWGYENKQSGFYLSSRFSITDPLTVIVGARNSSYDYQNYSMGVTQTQVSDSNITTPYFGVVYDINENFSTYASYTDIFDLQTQKDRDENLLDPEEGANYEVGVKAEFFNQRLNTSFALFEVQQDNVAVADGEPIYVPGFDIPQQRYRTEKGVTTKGYEAELSGEILPSLKIYAGYTHRKAKNAAGDEVTRQAPRDSLRLSGSYDLFQVLDGLTIGGGIRWQSKIYPSRDTTVGPNGNPATQSAYTLADIFVRHLITDNLSATLNINNLFDKSYYSSVGQYSFGYYGQPRNITASVKYNF